MERKCFGTQQPHQTADDLTSASELLAGREEELTFKFGSSKAFQFYRVVVTKGGLQNFSGKLQDEESAFAKFLMAWRVVQ